MGARLSVTEEEERLDRFLVRALGGVTRSQIKRAIDLGRAKVDGRPARASLRLHVGQVVEFEPLPPEPLAVEPEPMAIDVAFEDDHIVVVNKPPGLVVHPAAGNYRGTLVAGLLARSSLGGGDPFRPGIVHRLDKDTSGLLVVAKSVAAHEGLSAQFRKHTARRRYRALVRGVPATEGTIRTPYGRNPRDRLRFTGRRPAGRQAVTHYRVVEPFARLASMVLCELETGRTHQVRVHMSEIGHPLLCDALYGGTSCDRRIAPVLRALGRQALHAEHLAFDHPVTGERIELEAKLPEDMRQAVLLLRSLG